MRLSAAALLAALLAAAAPAAAFPDRPLTIVPPYSPGSAADAYARALGGHMARVLGQNVAVTNRDGGSGVAGMRSVAASPPDVRTLGLTPMTAVVVRPRLVRDLASGRRASRRSAARTRTSSAWWCAPIAPGRSGRIRPDSATGDG